MGRPAEVHDSSGQRPVEYESPAQKGLGEGWGLGRSGQEKGTIEKSCKKYEDIEMGGAKSKVRCRDHFWHDQKNVLSNKFILLWVLYFLTILSLAYITS